MSGQRDDSPGKAILWASRFGTSWFLISALMAVLCGDGSGVRAAAVVVDLALFAIGCVVFLWAYGIAVGRSRTDAIGIGGLFFLQGGVAPKEVQFELLAGVATQVIVALTTAAIRPFTSLAFGVLVPMFGVGLAGLWGARHGTFSPRGDGAGRSERER